MQKVVQFGFEHYLNKPGFIPIPKQAYFDYMQIVKNADAIVADGGGIQEDAYFFGIPMMVHRYTTERQEGLGENADISRMDIAKVNDFLRNHRSRDEFAAKLSDASPSAVVIDSLIKKGFMIAQSV